MTEQTPTGRVPDVTAGINTGPIGGTARFTAQMVTLVTRETKALVLKLAAERNESYGEVIREALDRALPGIAETEGDLAEGLRDWYAWSTDDPAALTAQLTIMGTPAQNNLAIKIVAARRVNNRRERARCRREGLPIPPGIHRVVTRSDVIRRALDLMLPTLQREQIKRIKEESAREAERRALAARLPEEVMETNGTGE